MGEWMRRAPRAVVAVVWLIAALLLAVGTTAHLTDLLRHGPRPYDWAPLWLNLYWTSLTLLDPLAALLLLGGHRRGLDLACAIAVSDLAAGAYAVYGPLHSSLIEQAGLQRLLGFALLVTGAAPFVRRHLSR
ncbi:hypothetical protein [Streptomyces sp. NPDC046887]|uniref:hypothetical protein n=1 Tax=Streptomyces sp. NPDC046887 TaxID=3155472 RepID=UPI0033D792E9